MLSHHHDLHARTHPQYKKNRLLGRESNKWWLRLFEKLMYAVAIAAPLALAPQIYEIFTTKNVSGISLLSWVILTGIHLLWIVYALVHKATPVLVSSFLFILMNIAGILGIILYS